jgi:hypothetical protein
MEITGWDWLITLSVDAINKQLAASQPLSKFNISGKSGLLKQNVRLQGVFGKWSIKGGSGQNLHLELPVSQGTLEIQDVTNRKVDLTDAVFTIALSLAFSPHDSNSRILLFDLSSAADEGKSPIAGQVGFLGIKPGKEQIDDNDARVAGFFLSKSLVENASKVDFIFASVLEPVAGTGWLVASHVSYAIEHAKGSTVHYLSVGGLVDAKAAVPEEVLLPPELVAGDPAAVIAMSSDMFFREVIQPLKPPQPDFPAHVGSMSYSNSIGVKADKVTYSAKYKCDVVKSTFFADITIANLDGSVSENMGISFDAKSQEIGFVKDDNAKITHHESANVGGTILASILSFFNLTSLADLGISLATLSCVPASFFNSIAIFNNLGLGSIKLAHGRAFKANSAKLNDVFYLTGTLE